MKALQLHKVRFYLRRAIEDFFEKKDFVAVETPVLVQAPGTEVYLDYFKSSWMDAKGGSFPVYLRSSPELHLKQALADGLAKIYHIGKVFRNGGELMGWHHPEFTMLEWYNSQTNFQAYMDETWELVKHTHEALSETSGLALIDLPPAPQRLSVYEAFDEFCQIKLCDQDPDLASKAISQGFHSVGPNDDFETSFFKLLLERVEPRLKELGAVFLYDYPPSQAALAKIIEGRAKRFELYLHGQELCNAFWELINPEQNQQRIADSNQKREIIGKEPIPVDQDFLQALARGLPECYGNALGFDRLLAILLGKTGIREVIPFRNHYPYRDELP